MPKYKAILFDMDGTIAETDQMIIHAMWDLYDLYNPSAKKKEEEIIYFSGPPIAETLKKEFPHMDNDFMVQQFLDVSTKYYDLYTTTFPGEMEVLKALKEKGYRLAVVTNKGHQKFEFVIGTGDIERLKPYPDGIYEAMKRFDVNKEETLYIGDNDIDYITASNAGIDVIICNWGPRKLTVLDKATHVASSYEDIRRILL